MDVAQNPDRIALDQQQIVFGRPAHSAGSLDLLGITISWPEQQSQAP